MLNVQSKSKGFTLIELLVVIAIIAILLTISVAAFGQANKKSRDAKRKGDLDAIKKALELAKLDCGGDNFPNYGGGALAFFGYLNYYTGSADGPLKIYLESLNYIKKGPTDPISSSFQRYFYKTATSISSITANVCPDSAVDGDSDGDDGSNNYRFWTTLENSNDPDAARSQSNCPWPGAAGGFVSYTYPSATYVVCPY